jgi:hypothetical protein
VTFFVNSLQAGVIEDEMDSLLHKRLNAGLSTFCIAQALLLVRCISLSMPRATRYRSVVKGSVIIIINPCKPYLTASAPRLTHWGGGK